MKYTVWSLSEILCESMTKPEKLSISCGEKPVFSATRIIEMCVEYASEHYEVVEVE